MIVSIELCLPLDNKIRGIYHVAPNYCQCHPETCCCNYWRLNDPNGEKVTTFYNKVDAESLAEKLNDKNKFHHGAAAAAGDDAAIPKDGK